MRYVCHVGKDISLANSHQMACACDQLQRLAGPASYRILKRPSPQAPTYVPRSRLWKPNSGTDVAYTRTHTHTHTTCTHACMHTCAERMHAWMTWLSLCRSQSSRNRVCVPVPVSVPVHVRVRVPVCVHAKGQRSQNSITNIWVLEHNIITDVLL